MSKLLTMQVNPGRGLGFITLGASLHDVLSRVKAQPNVYPAIDFVYSPSEPLISPVILNLLSNGIRLRFDGPDQRLRLIEIIDFSKTHLTYNNKSVVKIPEPSSDPDVIPSIPGPTFRHVYDRLIGPSFPGEYIPSKFVSDSPMGSYVLSYPGIALTFPLHDSTWSKSNDFVSVLSSSAAPAKSMAIFNGASWQEARQNLYSKVCNQPRSLALSSKGREGRSDEIESAKVLGGGKVDLIRRSTAVFHVKLGKTTPQDLVTELGAPDAIYRKLDQRLSIHKDHQRGLNSDGPRSPVSAPRYDDTTDTDQSSMHTTTDESDAQDEDRGLNAAQEDASPECFYNYFHHGFDVFLSYPTAPSQEPPGNETTKGHADSVCTNEVVATKILLHGNIPGSFPFNRYRRSRWTVQFEGLDPKMALMTSETPFSTLSKTLQKIWHGNPPNPAHKDRFQRGMVLNRGWGNSPGSSCELLGGWEEGMKPPAKDLDSDIAPGIGNTELFGFPGLVFEVMKNDSVSCLTVY